MKLAYWQYAGPAHIGALRVASSIKGVQSVMHGPLGDDYFNVMRSMLERERDFTPVYMNIVDRHVLGQGSKNNVIENLLRKKRMEKPKLLLLTPTCTSSILQEDLQGMVDRVSENYLAILADVNHYRMNELGASDRTLQQIIEVKLTRFEQKQRADKNKSSSIRSTQHYYKNLIPFLDHPDFKPALRRLIVQHQPSVNLIGPLSLGFHNRDDVLEIKRLLNELHINVNVVIPEGASLEDISNLPNAWLNVVMYREVGMMTSKYLSERFGTPACHIVPMGIVGLNQFVKQLSQIIQLQYKLRSEPTPSLLLDNNIELKDDSIKDAYEQNIVKYEEPNATKKSFDKNLESFIDSFIKVQSNYVSSAGWFSRSIDCQNLANKTAFVFGDATHSVGMTQFLRRELGITVLCAGTYCKENSEWFVNRTDSYCRENLITDNHSEVLAKIKELNPDAIFGTQMERHIGKRLGIPCGVISSPIHIQNFPLSYRPMYGYEGVNVLCDLVYNTYTLGMEDHLLETFGGHDSKKTKGSQTPIKEDSLPLDSAVPWDTEAIKIMSKIPFFARTKAQRLAEDLAKEKSYKMITIEVMMEAKERAAF